MVEIINENDGIELYSTTFDEMLSKSVLEMISDIFQATARRQIFADISFSEHMYVFNYNTVHLFLPTYFTKIGKMVGCQMTGT